MLFRNSAAVLLLLTNVALAAENEPSSSDPGGPASHASRPAVNMQPVAPGDFWSYEVKDEISGNITYTRTIVVTDVTKNAVATRFNAPRPGQFGSIEFDHSWNIVMSNAARYSPNDGTGVHLPLKLEARWNFAADVTNANGLALKRAGNSRVTGTELITTKAGSFDTTLIETSFSTRNPAEPTRKFETFVRTWFSPDVNHWIKRSTVAKQNGLAYESETIELVDYGRKK